MATVLRRKLLEFEFEIWAAGNQRETAIPLAVEEETGGCKVKKSLSKVKNCYKQSQKEIKTKIE